PGGQEAAVDGHPHRPREGQVRRHLRPGPQRPPRPGAVADGTGHRVGVAEPRHGGRYLAAAGEGEGRVVTGCLPSPACGRRCPEGADEGNSQEAALTPTLSRKRERGQSSGPMDTSTIPASYAVIAAMITPAFFLAAVGSLLISSNNRLARVVDRMRIEIQRLHETHGDARPELKARILIHRRRSYLVLGALRLLYGSLSAFVGTSIAIAVDAAVLDNRMIWL